MKKKLLVLSCGLGLTLGVLAQPANGYVRYCNTFCSSSQSGPCNCPLNSYYQPGAATTCAAWIDFCWHGYPPT